MPFRERFKRLGHKLSHQSSSIGIASVEPTATGSRPSDTLSLQVKEATDGRSLGSGTTDLWERAEQELRRDNSKRKIYDACIAVLECSSAELPADGERHVKFRKLLDSEAQKIEQQKWWVRLGSERVSVRDLFGTVGKRVLAVRDLVMGAASASPPAAIACAGAMAFLLVSALLPDGIALGRTSIACIVLADKNSCFLKPQDSRKFC